MLEKTRSLFRILFIFINLGIILVYLSVCLVPFLNTGNYWFLAFPGLAFPLLFLALCCFMIFWAVIRSGWFWVTLIALLLGVQQIAAVFSFHLPERFSAVKQPHTLRVFHWNIESWDDYADPKPGEISFRPQMMNLIRSQQADILCFEEYADKKRMKDSSSNLSTIIKMGYPYYLFAITAEKERYNPKGVIIFSKYPIIHSDTFSYGENTQAEHLISIDIQAGDKIFRIFTTHLQSVRFEHSDYASLSRLKHAEDPGYRDSRTIVSKLKRGYEYRYRQAEMVKQKIEESPYPVIITGDFNDVPNSNTYFTIRGKLQDTFLEKGYWIGRTFRYISPTLRIDYILADKRFKVNQFRVIHVPYSDHYPVEADLRY